jgi:hypothetical protein
MVMLTDLHAIWPEDTEFVPTRDLVNKLVVYNTEYWGLQSSYGKALTEKRLGKLVSAAAKVTSSRVGGRGPRGYARSKLEPIWHRLGIGRFESGASGYCGASDADCTGLTGSAGCTGSDETPTESGVINGQVARDAANTAYSKGLCRDGCGRPHSPARPRCNECHRIWVNIKAGYDK